MNIYFDNAATTRVRDEVISEISNILKDLGYKNIATCKDFQGLDRYTFANK